MSQIPPQEIQESSSTSQQPSVRLVNRNNNTGYTSPYTVASDIPRVGSPAVRQVPIIHVSGESSDMATAFRNTTVPFTLGRHDEFTRTNVPAIPTYVPAIPGEASSLPSSSNTARRIRPQGSAGSSVSTFYGNQTNDHQEGPSTTEQGGDPRMVNINDPLQVYHLLKGVLAVNARNMASQFLTESFSARLEITDPVFRIDILGDPQRVTGIKLWLGEYNGEFDT